MGKTYVFGDIDRHFLTGLRNSRHAPEGALRLSEKELNEKHLVAPDCDAMAWTAESKYPWDRKINAAQLYSTPYGRQSPQPNLNSVPLASSEPACVSPIPTA